MKYEDGHAPGWGRFPLIARAELDTAPDGLYELDAPLQRFAMYDLAGGTNYTAGEMRDYGQLVRIDAGSELPAGVPVSEFRRDGKRLIVAFAAVEGSGHPEFNLVCPCWLNGKPWPPEFFPKENEVQA